MSAETEYVRWFEEIGSGDVAEVGGKNASLGEMVRELREKRIQVPDGFATTAVAYRAFLEDNGLAGKISSLLDEMKNNEKSLDKTGESIRRLILRSPFSDKLANAIRQAYAELCGRYDTDGVSVAVRSSATAEDLPEASFAGQQESFLITRRAEFHGLARG